MTEFQEIVESSGMKTPKVHCSKSSIQKMSTMFHISNSNIRKEPKKKGNKVYAEGKKAHTSNKKLKKLEQTIRRNNRN